LPSCLDRRGLESSRVEFANPQDELNGSPDSEGITVQLIGLCYVWMGLWVNPR